MKIKPENYKKYAIVIVIVILTGVASVFLLPQKLFKLSGDGALIVVDRYDLLFYLRLVLSITIFMTLVIYLIYRSLNNYRKIKDNLELSEKRLRTIFENAPIGIALIDSETGKIQDANSNYLKITGLTTLDLENLSYLNSIHPDDESESRNFQQKILQGEVKTLYVKRRYKRNDGTIIWTQISASTIEKKKNNPPLYLCMIEEITDSKKAEEALKKSENELRSIFAAMDEIIIEVNSEGKILKIAPTNPSLLYKPADELVGKSVSEIFSKEKADLFVEKVKESIVANKVVKLEYELEIDGNNKIFEASASPLTFDSVLWIARDITERKQIEEEIKRKQINLEDAQRLAKMGSWEFDFLTKETKWSNGMYHIFEQDSNSLVDPYTLYRQLCLPSQLEIIGDTVRNAVNLKKNYSFEHQINLSDGRKKILSCIGEPVINSNGEVVGLKGTEQDITELKKMQDLLKLESLFNSSNNAIMLLTRENFFDCNPKTLELFGLKSKQEFAECHPSDLSPENQPDGANSFVKANQMIDYAFEHGENRFEWTHRRKGGDVFAAEVLLTPFDYGNERVLQATVTDITNRKLSEKKLQESEALLSTILQTLPVAVFGKDIKNNYKFSLWNKKAEEIFGITAEECVGKNDFDLFTKENADWYRQKDEEVVKQGLQIDIPEEMAQSKNKTVWVHTKKTMVKDSEGEPKFLLGVSEDITDRKKSEEELRKSEEKYRSVVQNAADMIMMLSKDRIVDFINHAHDGNNSVIDRVIGRSFYNFIDDSFENYVKQKMDSLFDDKTAQQFETIGVHVNGTKAWYSVNAGPLFSDDEVVGATLIIRNISERIEAEQRTKHSLEEKEILLKEVHHRVKNNLQIILSILNLQCANIVDRKTLDLLRDVTSRIKAMSFIHELLYQTSDFSKINFSEYINNITTNLIYSYTRKEIDLKLNLGRVFLDLDRAIPCGLIINELITNSLKYAFTEKENGAITIALNQDNEKVQMVISDNGKGFPENINYRNTESLGMQLVVTLVQQLRGEIVLDNSKGTKFTITFKYQPTEAEQLNS